METSQKRTHLESIPAHARQLFVTPTVTAQTTQMTVYNKVVAVTTATAITHIIMLPPVSECAGEIYVVRADDVGTSLTIKAYGDGTLFDALAWANIVMSTDDDYWIGLSDGTRWHTIATLNDDND